MGGSLEPPVVIQPGVRGEGQRDGAGQGEFEVGFPVATDLSPPIGLKLKSTVFFTHRQVDPLMIQFVLQALSRGRIAEVSPVQHDREHDPVHSRVIDQGGADDPTRSKPQAGDEHRQTERCALHGRAEPPAGSPGLLWLQIGWDRSGLHRSDATRSLLFDVHRGQLRTPTLGEN